MKKSHSFHFPYESSNNIVEFRPPKPIRLLIDSKPEYVISPGFIAFSIKYLVVSVFCQLVVIFLFVFNNQSHRRPISGLVSTYYTPCSTLAI